MTDTPNVGELGESPEAHERRRIAALTEQPIHTELVREREIEPTPMPALRLELTEAMKPLVAQAFGELVQFLGTLKSDIQAQTNLLATLNVPLEAVADSHERASVSFETLRKDLHDIGMETPAAIQDLARAMDTAGLNEAQSRAEKRFEALALAIERRLVSIVEVQNKSFAGIALDMTKILHLLERLQARELRDAKKRVTG